MKEFNTIVAASLLAADFAFIADAVRLAEDSGADWLHLDIMDGAFVPNLSFGPKMASDIRKLTELPIDVHLMVEQPERIAFDFVDAGADHVTFHTEATVHVHRLLESLRNRGVMTGVSIVPSTPVSMVVEILPFVDIVLVMTVNPGFGGQTLIPACLGKNRALGAIRSDRELSYRIAVDGGVNRSTVDEVRRSGADVLISGSAFFGAGDPATEVEFFRGVE